MEDRKRPHPYENDSAPPLKKQATSMNGSSKNHDADMPWEKDLERLQKDAILRQMNEYKREKNTLEKELNSLRKRTRYHDDHIRTVDLWFKQLIDEVKLMLPSSGDDSMEPNCFPSSLLFSDQETFQQHLPKWSAEVQDVITRLHNDRITPDVSALQTRLSQLLAAQKEYIVRLEKYESEREELNDRLESASLRYMMAEKKLDRAKSTTVAKMEKQALMGATKGNLEEGGPVKREDSTTNGVSDNVEALAELEEQINKANAISEKQKEQLEKLAEENLKLQSQLTEASTKSTEVNDDDFAKTELFKQFKSQHEDVIKRVNNLEALNIQLQEEAVKLRSERTAFKSQVEYESRGALSEKDAQLGAESANLARIRSSRDELLADHAVKKAQLDADWDSLRRTKELCGAQEERIKALESENERLMMQPGSMIVDSSEVDNLAPEDLCAMYAEIERKYRLLNVELTSMQTAFQKTSKLASQKVADHGALEEKALRLSAEKAKADQKFFAAMKSKETREGEVRTLRVQNSKSSDMIAQLKEAETASRALLANLEKQLAETAEALAKKTNDHRACQQQVTMHSHDISKLNAQIAQLKKSLAVKDITCASTSSACRAAEQEVEELKASLKHTKKDAESWKARGLSGHSEQYEMLRQIAYCNICKKDLKNTVIKTCGHTFCHNCVEDRLENRMRKCPNCGKSFGINDHQRITL